MSVAYGKGLRGKATRLHAELVRSRGACERCGSTRELQCAHIIRRRYAATRTDENNAFCLCAGCHRYFHEWPVDEAAFTIGRIGQEAFDALRAKAHAGVKANDAFWRSECERLSALLREVKERAA